VCRGTLVHGRREDFFQGGAKSGEICFLPLEIEKTTFFDNNFKIQEGPKAPPALPPLPTPMDWCAAEEAEVCRESFMF